MRIAQLILGAIVLTGCPGEPTYSEIRDDVFTPSCALSDLCHSSDSGGLDMSNPALVYDQLIDVESEDKEGAIRVIPFDPDNSYLVQKLEGHADIVGDPMPPGLPLAVTNPDRVRDIRQWIELGALDN